MSRRHEPRLGHVTRAWLTGLASMSHSFMFRLFKKSTKYWCDWKNNSCLLKEKSFLKARSYAGVSDMRRQWHPTPVPLPGKSHGQRSLVGCSPWGR